MNPMQLAKVVDLSPRQIRYWIAAGYTPPPSKERTFGPGSEMELTKEEIERILGMSVLVKKLGMNPASASRAVESARKRANGVFEAEVGSVSLFWRNPSL